MTGRTVRRHYFNLIEITVALAVLVTGLISVMGLFAHGIRANTKAAASNAAADNGQQLLNFLAAGARNNWVSELNRFQATPCANIAGGQGVLNPVDWDADDLEDVSGVQDVIPTLYFRDFSSPCSANTKVYRIHVESTTVNGGSVTDFDAIARVWKQPVTVWQYDGANWVAAEDSSYASRVNLIAELSWPAILPMSARDRQIFSMEVAREN